MPELLASGMACSLAAVIMTAPVTFYNFGVVYPAGIITSMVISPVVTLYMCLGLACVLIPAPVLIGTGLLHQTVLNWLFYLISAVVGMTSAVPGIRI